MPVLVMATARLLAPDRALRHTAPLGELLVPWAGAALLVALLRYEPLRPLDDLRVVLPRMPFVDEATAAAAVLIGAGVVTAWLRGGVGWRRPALLWTTAVLAVLLPRELPRAAVASGWALLSAPLLLLSSRDRSRPDSYLAGVVPLQVFALALVLTIAPPSSLWIDGAQRSVAAGGALLGDAAFVTGVLRWSRAWRAFGMALLALATAKVFLLDLQALDAAYKVPSFIGLGLLLLLSSFMYQRLRREA